MVSEEKKQTNNKGWRQLRNSAVNFFIFYFGSLLIFLFFYFGSLLVFLLNYTKDKKVETKIGTQNQLSKSKCQMETTEFPSSISHSLSASQVSIRSGRGPIWYGSKGNRTEPNTNRNFRMESLVSLAIEKIEPELNQSVPIQFDSVLFIENVKIKCSQIKNLKILPTWCF